MSLVALIVRLVLAAVLITAMAFSACGRAPRRAPRPDELGRLVLGAVLLYSAGLAAVLAHRSWLAIVAFALGTATATLAAWLSRGADADDGPGDGPPPADHRPPPLPDGAPRLDWSRFDRERERWAAGPGPSRPPLPR